MKKTNIIIISLYLSVFILTSVVHADVISPGAPSKDLGPPSKDPGASYKDKDASNDTGYSNDTGGSFKDVGGSPKDKDASNDTGASSKDELNSILIISAAIIGIIALIAWLVIRKIKK
jgi:hypothetical protein